MATEGIADSRDWWHYLLQSS